jgi:hypothetical protein
MKKGLIGAVILGAAIALTGNGCKPIEVYNSIDKFGMTYDYIGKIGKEDAITFRDNLLYFRLDITTEDSQVVSYYDWFKDGTLDYRKIAKRGESTFHPINEKGAVEAFKQQQKYTDYLGKILEIKKRASRNQGHLLEDIKKLPFLQNI